MTSPELGDCGGGKCWVREKRLFLNVQFSDDIADACVGSLDVFHPR